MNTKNLFRMAALAFVGACMVACSGSDEITTEPTPQSPTPNDGVVKLRCEVCINGGSGTRAVDATGKTSWTVGERVGVCYENTSLELVTSTDGTVVDIKPAKTENEKDTAVIEATLLRPGDGRKAYIITPFSQWNDDLTFHTIHLFNNQKGTLADVSENWDFAISDEATLWVSGNSIYARLNYDPQTKVSTPVVMRNQNCIWKLTLEDASHNAINATKLYINDGFNNYIISNNNQPASVFYVAMLPRADKTFTFTATRSGMSYSKSYTHVTTEASNFYTSTVTMDTEGVQLWEDGPYWATKNVGATNPEDLGLYFAWGDTQGHTASEQSAFGWNVYKWANDGSSSKLTKYCPSNQSSFWDGEGNPDNKLILDLADDAANANLGGNWRMPTREELMILIDMSGSTRVSRQGYSNYNNTNIAGCVFTGTQPGYTNNSIFLPLTGYMDSSGGPYDSSYGYYWSSELVNQSPSGAWTIHFKTDDYKGGYADSRCNGLCVRAVWSAPVPTNQ